MGEGDRARAGALPWVWVALWIGVILLFSSDVFSSASTQRALGQMPQPGPPPWHHHWLRQGSHLLLYGVLGALLVNALRGSSRGGHAPALGVAVMLGFAVAFCDESLQAASPARTGSIRDVVLDVWGLFAGGAALALLRGRPRREARDA